MILIMNMAGFYDESISNGVGWRAVLFVSGCPHHCPGCHNAIAQDYNYGEKFDKEKCFEKYINLYEEWCRWFLSAELTAAENQHK